ncbi:hypothetical protein GDO81_009883 [Engystomops pustulosus]|uniref:Golgin subfamily B member 1 n=4 Tax=Engystomops pustulosus TaxID=76066 RepID=A0AAV7BWA1_ENGPU|nr:hypothetical protein GDO81_009883 [Engystomops pustulosus]
MFSRLSGLANTVLHELSGDGEGSENTRDSDPRPESGTDVDMSEDQIERLAHYEQLVVQLKELIQHKDVEIQHKDAELKQKESQIKSEREASDAKFAKLKLQAKAKVTTLNKQIEELKRTVANQTSQDGTVDPNSNGLNESFKNVQDQEDATSNFQDKINELTRQLQESQSNISELTKQLSESQETIAGLTIQLQDSHESVNQLTKSLQEKDDAVNMVLEKQELEICQIQRTLEEKCEALLSRNQVVEMLEQELQSAELQKQVLSEQFREMEQQLVSVRESLVTEQNGNAQQTELYEDLLKEKSILCQQLEEALNKQKDSASEREYLKSQLEMAQQQLDNTPQHDIGQIRVEIERGMEEELERLRVELQKEKGAQAELQQLKADLKKEKGAQEELQELKEQLEKEKGAQEELQQLKEQLEKEKGAQEELQHLKEELEKAKVAQEELQHLKEELEKAKSAQQELQVLKEQLVKEKGAQEELQQFEKEKDAQEESQELKEQLEKEKGTQKELQELKEQLEKIVQEELQNLRAELETRKENQAQLEVELERLKESNEELLSKATGGQQESQNRNESDGCNLQMKMVEIELERGNKRQEELSLMKEELKKIEESLKDFDQVKAEIERGQKTLNELASMKQELEKIKDAQAELNTLQEEHKHISGLVVESQMDQKDCRASHSIENLNMQHHTVTTGDDTENISSVGECRESVSTHQISQATILNVKTSSLSQELVLDVTLEDVKEKQLSILMMDLLDTQKEINQLKGQMPVNEKVNECSQNEKAIEKREDVLEESDTHVHTSDSFDLKYQTTIVDKDAEITSMKKEVEDLHSQIEIITSEKKQISLKLEALRNGQTIAEEGLLQNEQLTAYESQNILVEQVNSLENESKSKDLKITALQKDLDHINLLVSERNEILKLQENHLEEKEKHIESLKEILELSQAKEERLSEELATNEHEKVLLQELISQKTLEIEGLQESISEKDRQVEEISHSLSDKVVALNEEKYSMSKEIKALKEQLNSTIQDQNEKGDVVLEALRTENLEMHVQIEKVTMEKSHLQEMHDTIQRELVELKCQLESEAIKLAQCQEIILISQGEQGTLQLQLKDQKSELLMKQKEYEELQIQLDAQKKYYEQELKLLTEKHQNSLEVIDGLQVEKSALESQLHADITKSQPEAREVGGRENEELQSQLEDHKKEIEQLKKKLQAALISRKELNRKISKLEKQLVNQDKNLTSDVEVKTLVEEVSQQSIVESDLKRQLSERESDLEAVQKELAEKNAANEQFQNFIEELTFELKEKSRQIELLKTEQAERTSAESHISHEGNSEDQEARIELKSRIATLEQDKEILQTKVQEVLNSRRDTIKKAQEKDRHHREQLKQHKEDFNLLQEKYKKLQLNQKAHPSEVANEERGTQTIQPSLSEKSQNTMPNISEDLISVSVADENSDGSHWGSDWVDFAPAITEDHMVDKSSVSDGTTKNYQTEMEVLHSHKNELELKASQLEDKLNCQLEEISHLQDIIEKLGQELQNEKEQNLNLEMRVSSLKAELEGSMQEISNLNEITIDHLKKELIHKGEEIEQLHHELEVVKAAIKDANMLVVEKDEVIQSLKTQLEAQAKEHEEHQRKIEMQSLESQNKQDEEMEEAKGKQQLQRKLQAALISRKEALKENKTLKMELDTVMDLKADLSSRLQLSEDLVKQLFVEKDTLLTTVSSQKEEKDKLIAEIDRSLLENQNLEASCESLKLALEGITKEREDLMKEFEAMKLSQNSQVFEWQEKLAELQKEYETLLQSYENVSNETDRMKRAVESVRQEKQELFGKIKALETEKKEVEKQLEEAEQEIESMKDKMRKFAKSKQQKILELEEENDKLRGELQPVAGQQNSDTINPETSNLKEELERLHSENHSLVLQLELINSEKESFAQEIETLRHHLHNVESNLQLSLQQPESEIHEEVIAKNEVEVIGSQLDGNKEVIGEQQANVDNEISQQQETIEENLQMTKLINKLESEAKIKQSETEIMNEEIKVLMEDKFSLDTQLSNLQSRVTKMETEIEELEKKYQIAVGDLKEVNKQKHAIELEKDELEERLMNQMAELNGSIGNFQQDAIDLQVKNDSLQKELENLHLQLEEEKRQLERQKIEALSEAQKEFVEKLKSANQSAKGRKTESKELQELLREKQQEVRHLQKDCIQYQETISGLEREIKTLEFEHGNCEKEKLVSSNKLMKAMEDTKSAQNDLASFRVLLDDTQSEAARVLAENMKLKDEMRRITENTTAMLKKKEEDMERRLDIERDKHTKQIVNLQEKVNGLQQENERLQGTIVDFQNRILEKDQEMKDLQANLNQNIAKLAAFTRSMCSLQNDRDRVVDESKKWSEKFTDAMQKKDIEINDKEKVCMNLKNELLQITSHLEELKVEVNRLQTENKELVTSQQMEAEAHLKMRDSLFEEKAILSSSLEEEQKIHSICQQELKRCTQEANDRQNQLEALEIEVNQIKSENESLLGAVKGLEAEVQNLMLRNEQILSDLQASKSLIEQLHKELEQKEQDVVQLLNSRDEAVSTAVGELHDVHAIECKMLEDRLKETEKERLDFQDKMEILKTQLMASQEEVDRSKGQLDSFTKSMRSLQEERERVLSDYQQLEQRHLDAILAKDGLIQDAAAESNKLREELRLLRSRTDDLNAQNAKLNAQLTRYRDDLKELISLKDSQLKQLLGEKLQEIEKLRHEQSNQEQQLMQEKGQREILQQELDETKVAKQQLLEEVDNLKLFVSQLQNELGIQGNQHEQAKQEILLLKDELLEMQNKLAHIEEESSRIQVEAEQRVQRAEDELDKKLQSMQHDTGILRNETETAEERVAELARDLMESEQRLLTANEEIAALKAKLQAFEGSMRSLQDSHDLAQEEIQRLWEQRSEVSVLNAEISESKDLQSRLEMQIKDIMKTLQTKEEEITRITSELHISQTQLQMMSKEMFIQQENQSVLQGSLKAPRKEIERSLQSSSQKDTKISSIEAGISVEEFQKVQTEVQNLNSQLGDTLKQVHHKELRIQQLNSKLSQMFEEKNALSIQLRGSNQHLRDATSRCSSLERQVQVLQQKNLEALPSDSAPGAPQEKMEPQTETDQQLLELQQRYSELKHQNVEQEQVRSVLEQQLREERQISESRIQELEENLNKLRSHDSPASLHSAPHETSLLIETHGTRSVKTRGSSLRRFLRFFLCSRTKAPLLFSVYLLLIHVLLFLCFTGHL